jgi:hypothetical protein
MQYRIALFKLLSVICLAPLVVEGCSSSTTTTPSGPHRASLIYVGDTSAETISVFPATATGGIAPNTVNADASINGPFYVFFDATGSRIWSANCRVHTVTAYPSNFSGNTAPSVTLNPPGTLPCPTGLWIHATGKIYIADNANAVFYVFAAGSSGAAAPASTVTGANTSLAGPEGLWVDSAGNVYVGTDAGKVLIFAPPAAGSSNPTPTIISGANTMLTLVTGVSLDTAGNIWAAEYTNGLVTEFAPGSSGNASPIKFIQSSTIVHPYQVRVDALGFVYVADAGGNVAVFGPSQSGMGVTPMQTITGGSSGLVAPGGLDIR